MYTSNYYALTVKLYIYLFLSLIFEMVIVASDINNEFYALLLYLLFTLWYFNFISLNTILTVGLIIYLLYETGAIYKIEQKITDAYIKQVKNIHENTGFILAQFHSKNTDPISNLQL